MTTFSMSKCCSKWRLSGRWAHGACFGVLFFSWALGAVGQANQIVYDDALENGWQDWGWVTRNYTNTSPVHSGSDSISVTIDTVWGGIQIWHADQSSAPYSGISFWLDGGTSGG